MTSAEDVAGTGAIPPVLFVSVTYYLCHLVTSRKDWLTTKNRFVTSGETDVIQGRLGTGYERYAAQQTVFVMEHHISDYIKDEQALPPVSFEKGGGVKDQWQKTKQEIYVD